MQTFLSRLAVLQIAAVAVAALASAAFVVVAGDGRFPFFWVSVAAFVLLPLALLGGILWCLTTIPLPRHPGPPPKRRPMRFWLRILAQVEMGAGSMVTVAATTYASDTLLIRPWRGGHPLEALAILFATLGLVGIGGLLWCAVRVAYPDEPAVK